MIDLKDKILVDIQEYNNLRKIENNFIEKAKEHWKIFFEIWKTEERYILENKIRERLELDYKYMSKSLFYIYLILNIIWFYILYYTI